MVSISDVIRLIEGKRYDVIYNMLLSHPDIIDDLKHVISNYRDILVRVMVSHILSTGEIIGSNNKIVLKVFNGELPSQVRYANTLVFIDKVLGMLDKGMIGEAINYIRRNKDYIADPEKTVEYIIANAYLSRHVTPEEIIEIYSKTGIKQPKKLLLIIKSLEEINDLVSNKDKLISYVMDKVGEKIRQSLDQPIDKLVEHPDILRLLGLTDKQIEELKALVSSGLHDLVLKLYGVLKNISMDNITTAVELLIQAKHRLDEYRDKLGELYSTYNSVLRKIAETISEPAIYVLVSRNQLERAEKLAGKLDKLFNIGVKNIVDRIKSIENITPRQALELIG